MLTSTLAAMLAGSAFAAAPAAPKAPEFKIAKVFNAPVSEIKSLASLKGKVVFLEFWATWCGPCVAGVPRTNRLIDALKGEPVVFLAVTDEPADMIEAYLKHHEMKAWVGVDEAKSSLKAYKNKSRPDGYLIGKEGRLLGRIFPDHLTEADIRAAIAGTYTAKTGETSDDPEPPSYANGETALFEIVISSATSKPYMRWGEDSIEASGLQFALNVASIWDVEEDQVIIDGPSLRAFDFRLKTREGGLERGRDLLKQAVLSAFGVTVRSELRDTDVFLLALSTAPGAPRPQAGDPSLKSGLMGMGGGRLLGKATMPAFAKSLWMSTGKPVIDDTSLTGEYFLDLEWKRADDADRDKALATQGLRLLPGRRKVEFLRVVPIVKN